METLATETGRNPGRMLALAGAWMQAALAIGMAISAVQMTRAFQVLSAAGVGDPAALSSAIGHVLYATAAGMAISLIGLILICLALYKYRYRAPWFWYFLIPAGALLLAAFPVGTPFGIAFLITAIGRRAEFFPATPLDWSGGAPRQ